MKVALVHDALINKGGAERVFKIFCEIFPKATIYTSIYFEDKTFSFFKDRKINTTPLQRYISNEYQFKLLFPLANYFMYSLNLNDYDIVLSSSTTFGKYVKSIGGKHICYCYTPFRFLWDPQSYGINKKSVKYKFIKPFLSLFKKWDYEVSQGIDYFIAMTDQMKIRIKKIYNRDSIVLPPPIESKKYVFSDSNENYFLVVSRHEPYKKVDLVIKAFNKLKLPLRVIGVGTMSDSLKNIAQENIIFHGLVNESELIDLYSKAIALVFPQKEDYGLTPLEANASGKPVICYGFGGVETTMVPYNGQNIEKATALFFYHQTVDDLIDAVKKFNKLNFNPESLRLNAKKFDVLNFKRDIYNYILNVKNG